MTDRELLELAAKAAGVYRDALDCEWYDPHGHVRPDWNPLTDDGDALRLAVALGILILPDRGFAVANHNDIASAIRIPVLDDPYAATRRAIVRAAAEIGRQHD